MKQVVMLLCLLVCVTGLAPTANAVTLDFEVLMHADDLIVDHGATYTEDGFMLKNTATEEISSFPPSFASLGTELTGLFSGSTALLNDNWGGETVLTRIDGGAFSLSSIDLSELIATGDLFDVLFTGVSYENHSLVSKTVSLDGIFGAETFSFGADFANLLSVSWIQTLSPHQFDNIAVNPVPEPGSIFLVSAGFLLALGAEKRFTKKLR